MDIRVSQEYYYGILIKKTTLYPEKNRPYYSNRLKKMTLFGVNSLTDCMQYEDKIMINMNSAVF